MQEGGRRTGQHPGLCSTDPSPLILSVGVAGAGRRERLTGANRGHGSGERPARHCPRGFLYRGRQVRLIIPPPPDVLIPSPYHPSWVSWGSFQRLLALFPRRNVIHGSDSVDSARREIAHWFHPNELLCWEDNTEHWLYE